jgi:pyrroline-5-carboxylate reductase
MEKIGFLGTGAITQAVVTGLCTQAEPPKSILVSPRNADRATALARDFAQVSIAKSNEDLVAQSDIVCLAVRPEHAVEILSTLTFREDQTVVSFISTLKLADIYTHVAPASNIARMIPLPPVAKHLGPIAICPPLPKVIDTFSNIGDVVAVENEDKLYSLWAATALMAPYFGLMGEITTWLWQRNIDETLAKSYIASMFHSLSVTAKSSELKFPELVVDHSTPGGLNEQANRELINTGWMESVPQVLSLIEKRLNHSADFTTTLDN